MRRFLIAALLAAGLVSTLTAQDRGRPVILLVHGRGMLDRDTALTRKLWFDGLVAGSKTLTSSPVIEERDVRVVWYADVLDPQSTEACDYASNDPRAKRAAKANDDGLRQFASLAGGFLNLISSMVDDRQSAGELRSFASDASFFGDPRKRCATEARLGTAVERARSEGRPVIVVAHSMGAFVAYDYLSTRTDTGLVQRFVTIGSPLASPDLRRLLIGGDSTDAFTMPASVRDWVNVRNNGDDLAVPLPFGRDLVTEPPAGEADRHEMVGYLRGTSTAREILSAWCGALASGRPSGCKDVISR